MPRRRLLLVEPSTAMRQVLEGHLRALGHALDAFADYGDALAALERRARAFDDEYALVLLGWPVRPESAADAFAERLEAVDLAELPVIVLSTDLRAATRAWVAERGRAALLHWRDYRGVDAALARLLDEAGRGEDDANADAARGAANLARAGRPDASSGTADGVGVLVVDDSAMGRRALRELLVGRGYRVALAASAPEALARARAERFDIALIDFHLGEVTGDGLCRALLADVRCGEPLCVVLVDAYGDALIRRCLAAGATDCLFRRESLGLVLARVDALARLVRRLRAREESGRLWERALGLLGGAVLLLDAAGHVRAASPEARTAIDAGADERLDGIALHRRLGLASLPPIGAAPERVRLRGAGGREIDAALVRLALDEGASLLRLGRALGAEEEGPATPTAAAPAAGEVPAASPPSAATAVDGSPAAPRDRPSGGRVAPAEASASRRPPPGLPVSIAPFLAELRRRLAGGGDGPARSSLFVLGLFEQDARGGRRPVGGVLAARASVALQRLYRFERHVGWLGAHRVGVILRHEDEGQAWRLAARLMQACIALGRGSDGVRLEASACLLALEGRAERPAVESVGEALRALAAMEERGVLGRVLLLDRRRLLALPGPGRRDAGGGSDGPGGDPAG